MAEALLVLPGQAAETEPEGGGRLRQEEECDMRDTDEACDSDHDSAEPCDSDQGGSEPGWRGGAAAGSAETVRKTAAAATGAAAAAGCCERASVGGVEWPPNGPGGDGRGGSERRQSCAPRGNDDGSIK